MTCCASESNTSVRVVFANRSGFYAPIGVVMAWEERGSCLNIFRMTNRSRISETFTNYEAKYLSRKLVKHVVANRCGFDAPIGVVLAWQERGSCLKIFQTTNRGQISETFKNYEAKDLLRKSVDHILTYFGRQIADGSKKPSRITRQKTCCASDSNTSVCIVFANQSGFDAPIGVVLAWEKRVSCLNIFSTSNGGRISETFTNYAAKDFLRKKKTYCASESNTSVRVVFANRSRFDAAIGVVMAWEERGTCLNIFRTKNCVGSQKPSQITRQKTCCANESNTSVRVVFANRSGFDAPIGVFMAREERGSCLNILRTTNRGRISETFTNYEAKNLLRNESNTSVRIVFVNRSGFHAPIGWEDRGSCLNIFRTINLGRISETFMKYEAKDLLRNHLVMGGAWIKSYHIPDDKSRSDLRNLHESRGKRLVAQDDKLRSDLRNLHELRAKRLVALVSQTRWFALYLRTGVVLMLQLESSWHGRSVDHVLTYSKRPIAVGSQKPSRITRQKTCCAIVLAWEEHGSCHKMFRTTIGVGSKKPSRITRQKTCCASESNTSVCVVFANRSGFDAPIGVVLAWEEHGPCLNIFRKTNHGRIPETFTYYEAKELLPKEITVGSRKPSRIMRQKTSCASESNTSVRVVFVNRSGFDAPIAVVMAWEVRGSCLNIFRTTNCERISETSTNYEGKDLLRKSVDNVLTYFGRQIAVGSQKPSRIRRQMTCCASESNSLVRVVFANRSGFDAPIGVFLAWEDHGSCLNIFRMTNHGRISETFTNYEAKDLLRYGFDGPIGVFMAWEERGSCLNIFWTTNRGRVFETFTNYEANDLLRKSVDHVLTYSGRQIAVVSLKPSRITRQITCCANESNTSVRVVLANRSGFDAPIGWEARGSCLNIFRTTNRGRILETFTNYEAKDLLRE
ncbi:uncharacterized protein G2W53_041708 [Senna tora]|uniref:Uncharacterized protein n=1 Tax=Senna tora TaxID=362788 RepID=A0A834VZ05_9FABA|nr:uncharacterized protein G2W53_041708 [Senna tora]